MILRLRPYGKYPAYHQPATFCAPTVSVWCLSPKMNSSHCEEILLKHGIRPTAVRMLALEAMERFDHTFSLSDLETEADTLDKSSIFRSLTLFAEHHLLHVIEDGSGATKYCLCHNDHACRIEELHCHFHCEACGKTFCLDNVHIPVIHYPAGYEVREINYLVKGRCPDCRSKR